MTLLFVLGVIFDPMMQQNNLLLTVLNVTSKKTFRTTTAFSCKRQTFNKRRLGLCLESSSESAGCLYSSTEIRDYLFYLCTSSWPLLFSRNTASINSLACHWWSAWPCTLAGCLRIVSFTAEGRGPRIPTWQQFNVSTRDQVLSSVYSRFLLVCC